MTELVFCESLGGALKMAKGMRPGTVQHGVRCMLYEDGTQTSEEYEEVWQAPRRAGHGGRGGLPCAGAFHGGYFRPAGP